MPLGRLDHDDVFGDSLDDLGADVKVRPVTSEASCRRLQNLGTPSLLFVLRPGVG
jgi:hypothetical protein